MVTLVLAISFHSKSPREPGGERIFKIGQYSMKVSKRVCFVFSDSRCKLMCLMVKRNVHDINVTLHLQEPPTIYLRDLVYHSL